MRAQLLTTLSANMTPYGDDHALFVRVLALENRLPHVYQDTPFHPAFRRGETALARPSCAELFTKPPQPARR